MALNLPLLTWIQFYHDFFSPQNLLFDQDLTTYLWSNNTGIVHEYKLDLTNLRSYHLYKKCLIDNIHVGRSGSEWRHSKAMASCQIFLVVSMIWFSYTDKLYINMLGITFSPQNYHHHQQFLSKLRENNENGMTSAVWACYDFGPRVWQLSARC